MLDQLEKRMERRAAFEAETLRLMAERDLPEIKRLLQRFTETGEEDKS